MKDSTLAATLGLLAALSGLAIFWSICRVSQAGARDTQYQVACVAAKGTPVHNGRQWECLK